MSSLQKQTAVGASPAAAKRQAGEPPGPSGATAGDSRPLAIIIKGNPKYIEDPQAKPMADAFYGAIEAILLAGGLRVEFDSGEPRTIPRAGAAAWLGHSRGADRLQYAPPGVLTLEILACAGPPLPCSHGAIGLAASHYCLSIQDAAALSTLISKLAEPPASFRQPECFEPHTSRFAP